jgi:hypothetical protein
VPPEIFNICGQSPGINTYSHVPPALQADAAEKLDGFWGEGRYPITTRSGP